MYKVPASELLKCVKEDVFCTFFGPRFPCFDNQTVRFFMEFDERTNALFSDISNGDATGKKLGEDLASTLSDFLIVWFSGPFM